MFKFIKRLFSTETESIEIPRHELPNWFNKQFEDKVAALKVEANNTISQIKNILEKLSQAVEKLRSSEGKKDAKVKPKVKQVVLSSRDLLVQHISLFCQRTTPPENLALDQTLDSLKKIQEEINRLAKLTNKSYHIAQHLFFEEVESTARLLKELDSAIVNFESRLKNAKYPNYKDIQSLIKKMYQQQQTKKVLEEEKEAMLKDKESVEKTEKELQKKQEQLLASHDYKKLARRKKELEESKEKLTQTQNTIFHMFSQFQRPLRKLNKICLNNQKQTHDYADDPLKALRNDSMLLIINVLQDLERNIKNGSIELKNKEKTLAKISELTKEKIQSIKDDWLATEKSIKELENSIADNETRQRLEKLQANIQQTESRLTKINATIMEIDKKINAIITQPMEEQIIENINTTFRTRLSLC